MSERLIDKKERTIVGVPFYDGEGPDVLQACLTNVDSCLNDLGIDAQIVVGINGPRVSMGYDPISQAIKGIRSKYNADIKFIKTPPGQCHAMNCLSKYAKDEIGCARMFLTDADISRLPNSFDLMWKEGNKPLVGVRYAAYPIEIMLDAGVNLTQQEIALIDIFEADKDPIVREFTQELRSKDRVKGSLMLVDTNLATHMHGLQNTTSDSRINVNVPGGDRQIVEGTGFMHWPRTDLKDHITARLRHFKAAAVDGDFDRQCKKESFCSSKDANIIASRILNRYPQEQRSVSNFLIRTALRHRVAEICSCIVRGRSLREESTIEQGHLDLLQVVYTYEEAAKVVSNLFSLFDWSDLSAPISNGCGTTQKERRVPIDLGPYLNTDTKRGLIYSRLGIKES